MYFSLFVLYSAGTECYNPDFKVVEFDHFKAEAGLHTFTLSTKKWIEKTNAIGMYVQAGRYGGTYAHKDIAFEFGSAISPVFKLYLLKEYQRLKDEENDRLKLEWDAKRFLSKSNYLIHTDAIKHYILPNTDFIASMEWLAYADEADLLNVALFGFTAKAWREANPELAKTGNVRDYASIAELTVLSNLETHNAELIKTFSPPVLWSAGNQCVLFRSFFPPPHMLFLRMPDPSDLIYA